MPTRRTTLCAALLLALAVPAAAAAQDGGTCTPPTGYGPHDYFPAAGAPDVPVNAPLRVRYDVGSSSYFTDAPGSLITLEQDSSGTRTRVAGNASWLGDTLVFVPTTALRAATHYVGTVVTAATMSGTEEFRFTTSSSTDFRAPEIGSISSVTSTVASVTCDAPDGGYRLTVTFPQAHDSDSARGDLEYLLYVTRAAEIHEPTLEARVRNFPSASITMSFVLPRSQSTARVCVVVMVVDDLGQTAQTDETCVNPIQGNYFEPLCTVSRAGVGGAAPGTGIAALAGALAALRLRRRRR